MVPKFEYTCVVWRRGRQNADDGMSWMLMLVLVLVLLDLMKDRYHRWQGSMPCLMHSSCTSCLS